MKKTKQDLKQAALGAVDTMAKEIYKTADFLFDHPELGYKETKATAHVAGILEAAGFEVQKNIAVTGVAARAPEKKDGPTLALMGELDAIVCKEHPRAGEGGVR